MNIHGSSICDGPKLETSSLGKLMNKHIIYRSSSTYDGVYMLIDPLEVKNSIS